MIIISDSSPLISLAVIQQLNLLEIIYKKVYVPPAVYREVTKEGKPFYKELKLFLKDKILEVDNKLAVEMLRKYIGLGEAESIVLSLEQKSTLLIDDLKARKFAKLNGLNIIGTIGLLLQAKELGLITNIKSLISILSSKGIRISQTIIDIALKSAKEL